MAGKSGRRIRGWGAVHKADPDPLVEQRRTVEVCCLVCGMPGPYLVTPEAAKSTKYYCTKCWNEKEPNP